MFSSIEVARGTELHGLIRILIASAACRKKCSKVNENTGQGVHFSIIRCTAGAMPAVDEAGCSGVLHTRCS